MSLLLSSRRSSWFRLLAVLAVAAGALSSATIGPAQATPLAGILSGVVRDDDGVAQDRADVVLVDATGATVATDRTDASGRYTLGVAAVGSYDLAVVTADTPTRMTAWVRSVGIGPDTTLDVVVLERFRPPANRMAAASTPPTTGPLGPSSESPATVTWTGTVRHNGVPVRGEISLDGPPLLGYTDTDDDGTFEIQVPPGRYPLDLRAHVGTTLRYDSDPPSPGLHVLVPDVEITADREMDINISTTNFTVHVVEEDGQPGSALVGGTTSGGDPTQGADVELFPGGRGRGWLTDHASTGADGTATLLMLGDTPPATVYAESDYGAGGADVAPGATSVTVRLVANVELSGTVRDARGPLPLANSPWVNFGGPGAHWDPFTGDHIRSDGTYYLTTQPGNRTLTITDLPDFEEDDPDDNQATPTMPKVWEIRADLDMSASRTLDLTIPDAAPVDFRAVGTDGRTLPVTGFGANSTHTITIAPGLTATATAESEGPAYDGRFQHMMFGPAEVEVGFNGPDGGASTGRLPLTPGRQVVLAAAARYTPGSVDIPEPTTTTTLISGFPPDRNPGDPAHTTSQTPGHSGYWALTSDGHVYNFGDALQHGNGASGAVDLEPTPTGKGYWILDQDGKVAASGDATPLGDVQLSKLAKDEHPASVSATPSGKGYWVFTNRGRAIAFGDAPHLGDMAQVKLNGPVLGSVATPSGRGYYMVASDGGIFAFGDAAFAGSMGGKKLNAAVQSLVPDADGKGYWLVASDGGIFAFDAPFKGSLGGMKLNKPVVGMVRYGDGYLMVGADGGIFNFSPLPFSGSLGDNPPASPVVAVAALP